MKAVSDGDDICSRNAAFSQVPPAQLEGVEAIAVDTGAAYVKSVKENILLAEQKIARNRFYITKMATDTVDKVRKGENRRRRGPGDHRWSGTNYL